MKLQSFTIFGAAVLCAAPTLAPLAGAQEASKAEAADGVMIVQGSGNFVPAQAEFISTELAVSGEPVKNAPYSAEAVIENVQTLGDGNRIVHTSKKSISRDSEGRTRTEQDLQRIGPWSSDEAKSLVMINDPVAGVNYVLLPDTKTARKLPEARVFATTKVDRELKAEREKKVVVESMAIAGAGQVVGGEPNVVVASVPGPTTGRIQLGGFSDKDAKKESLGKHTIEGVEAEGTRSTILIPAGKIGNERDIEIVSEEWYSHELQTVVMSSYKDPRFGETTYRLTNIDRSEPSKSLFEVPAEYKVEDLSMPVRVRTKRPL